MRTAEYGPRCTHCRHTWTMAVRAMLRLGLQTATRAQDRQGTGGLLGHPGRMLGGRRKRGQLAAALPSGVRGQRHKRPPQVSAYLSTSGPRRSNSAGAFPPGCPYRNAGRHRRSDRGLPGLRDAPEQATPCWEGSVCVSIVGGKSAPKLDCWQVCLFWCRLTPASPAHKRPPCADSQQLRPICCRQNRRLIEGGSP